MATVTPILRQSKRDRKGRAPIWLRISDRDKTRFLSLGVKVLPSQWNPRQGKVRAGHPNADLINQLISKHLQEAEAEIVRQKLSDNYASADDLKQSLSREGEQDFFAFADRYVEGLKRRGNIGRYRRLKATLKKFRAFSGEPLYFDRIGVRLLRDFETHCLVELENKQSTIATNLTDLRTLYNKAAEEGIVEYAGSPFQRYRIKKGEPAERTKLTFAEVQALESLGPEEGVEEGSLLSTYRDLFLFAFYSAGIRFSDAAMMTAARIVSGEEGGPDRLVYQAGKTGKRQSIKITPPARRILSRYLTADKSDEDFVFPLLEGYDLSTPREAYNARSSQNALCNKYLRKLAALASIDKPISMHVARHSFADAARTAGWSIYDISKALQHSSVAMTQRYLAAFDAGALDTKMDELFGGDVA